MIQGYPAKADTMKLKLSSRPFDFRPEKIILYPKSELTFVANLTMIFAIAILVAGIATREYVYTLGGVFSLLFIGAVILYIYGAQSLIFDTRRQEIHRKTFFRDKYLCGFSDISHIELIVHPGYDIAHYRCFLKKEPNGKGIKMSVNFKDDDKDFISMTQTAIPALMVILFSDAGEFVLPKATTDDTVFFRKIGNNVFCHRYMDYPAFFMVISTFILFYFLPLITGSYHFFILMIIPAILLYLQSWIIIDRNRRLILTSSWWGFDKKRIPYTDLRILGIESHGSREGMLGGTSIYAIMKDGSPHLIIKKMLMEERAPRLIQEIEVLTKS